MSSASTETNANGAAPRAPRDDMDIGPQPDASVAAGGLRTLRTRGRAPFVLRMRVRVPRVVEVRQPPPRTLVEAVDLLEPVGRDGGGVDVAEHLDDLRVELRPGMG